MSDEEVPKESTIELLKDLRELRLENERLVRQNQDLLDQVVKLHSLISKNEQQYQTAYRERSRLQLQVNNLMKKQTPLGELYGAPHPQQQGGEKE